MQRNFTQVLDLHDIEFVEEASGWATQTLATDEIEEVDPDALGLDADELVPTQDDNQVYREPRRANDFDEEITRVWIRPYAARLKVTARRGRARALQS